MACSSCTTNKSKVGKQNEITPIVNKSAIFDTKLGKIMYFAICVIVCLSPIINFAGLYMFYKAIFGTNKNKDTVNLETDDKITKD